MNDSLKFVVPGKSEYISPVRMAVAALASELGFDVDAIEDIKMAVSEACSKAVCPGGGEFGRYEVTCKAEPDALVISVIDTNGGCHHLESADECFECTKNGGLGLSIVKALMDEVTVYEEAGVGSGLRMKKRVK